MSEVDSVGIVLVVVWIFIFGRSSASGLGWGILMFKIHRKKRRFTRKCGCAPEIIVLRERDIEVLQLKPRPRQVVYGSVARMLILIGNTIECRMIDKHQQLLAELALNK